MGQRTQGTQPYGVTGCRALAPPAEEQEAVSVADSSLGCKFLSCSGMRGVWPCANLSTGCKYWGKWS